MKLMTAMALLHPSRIYPTGYLTSLQHQWGRDIPLQEFLCDPGTTLRGKGPTTKRQLRARFMEGSVELRAQAKCSVDAYAFTNLDTLDRGGVDTGRLLPGNSNRIASMRAEAAARRRAALGVVTMPNWQPRNRARTK